MTHLRRHEWDVVDVPLRTAQRFAEELHYAKGGPNTGTFVHGLVRRDDPLTVMGIAWWLPPTRVAAESVHEDWRRVLTLSRLVIRPEVPTNGASFLLAGSVKMIERTGRWRALVTYADTRQGHTGAIYRAANWTYVGMTPPEPVYVDERTARIVARKSAGFSRTHAEMLALGCRREVSPGKHKFVRELKVPRVREGALF